MATLSLLRIAGGMTASRLLGPQLIRKTSPILAAAATQSKTLKVSAPSQIRIYGPAEPGLPSKTHHWKTERILAVSLLGILPTTFIYPCVPLDLIVATGVCLHIHWSLDAVTTDYMHGTMLKPFGKTALYIGSALAYACILYFIFNDVGIGAGARLLWTI